MGVTQTNDSQIRSSNHLTTFGYVVTYGELMQSARVLIANYQSLVPVYLVVALLYCLVNYAISRASQRLGRPMY